MPPRYAACGADDQTDDDVVLREAEGRLSGPIEGIVRCAQNRARLVRALYEHLEAAAAPAV